MREAEQARAAETKGEVKETLQPSQHRQMDFGCCGIGVRRQAAGPAALCSLHLFQKPTAVPGRFCLWQMPRARFSLLEWWPGAGSWECWCLRGLEMSFTFWGLTVVVPPRTRPVAGVAVPSEPNSAAASSAPAPPAQSGLGSSAAAAEGTSAVFKLAFSN